MRGDKYITRKEIELPFENLRNDSIPGERLYDAFSSSFEEIPQYRAIEEETKIKAYKGSLLSRFLPRSRPYIEIEIDKSDDYSYICAVLSASEEERIESLEADLEDLEVKIESYFRDSNLGERRQDQKIDGFGPKYRL